MAQWMNIQQHKRYINPIIANVLMCKAHLKSKFKCVCVTIFSLVMSLFSRDYIKMEID